jgi:hypothetical protein
MWLKRFWQRPAPIGNGRKASCSRRTRFSLEPLEDRTVPATFTAASVSDLIADINAANLTAEADTITLAPGKTFTLTKANNTDHGPTGLPTIAAGEALTIIGNGDVIERSKAPRTPLFRVFAVDDGASLTLENLTVQGGTQSFGETSRRSAGPSPISAR